ncbi:MAG TPA: cell division protein ZapA [Acetobacteraceae bacterium]
MAQVSLKINGYAYTVGCEDGQENHLRAMAGAVEERMTRVKAMGSQSGESRLLVLAALLMADELHDMAADLADAQTRPYPAPGPAPGQTSLPPPVEPGHLAQLAERAESIAAAMERA